MNGAVFWRHERVYYVLGYADDAKSLALALEGRPNPKPTNTRDKRIVYMERVGSAPLHRDDMMKKLGDRAGARALQLAGMENAA